MKQGLPSTSKSQKLTISNRSVSPKEEPRAARFRVRAASQSCKALLVLLAWLSWCGLASADDYEMDPSPGYVERYVQLDESARYPKDCALYLQNLRYFARRTVPLSCGQPIAPNLAKQIRVPQWENLDPDQYSDLFRELASVF